MPCAHQQHGVAIDDTTLGVDEDRTVTVAVERHAHAAARFPNGARDLPGWVEPQSGRYFVHRG
jgi:hypothetical protein